MSKKLILSAALIIFAIFIGIFLSYQYSAGAESSPVAEPPIKSGEQTTAPPQEELPSEAPSEAPKPEDVGEEPPSSGYYLRDYNGKIAIFPVGSEVPEMVFDVFTRILPQSDQERLQEGVYVADYEELTRLVEDYIS